MIKFKEIPLLPTNFYLDVWVCDNLDEISEEFSKRYGASIEKYKKWITPDQVAVIKAKEESPRPGNIRIVMNISEMENNVIVHEIIHVIFKLGKLCYIEISRKSQEWVAYLTEYIYVEILKDNYQILEK